MKCFAMPLPNVFNTQDRKSTRLNSSHSQISYAVFCLKKTKDANIRTLRAMDLDKRRLNADRTHVLKISGTYDLPSGPGKRFVQEKVFGKVVGGWQLAA